MDEQPKSDNDGQPNWQFSADSDQSDTTEAPKEQVAEQPGNDDLMTTDSADGQPAMAREAGSSDNGEIEWTASEFIARHKPFWWYLALAVIAAALAAAVYFSSHDYIAVAAVIIVCIIFGIIAARKPRSLTYKLDRRGLSIAGKLYPYNRFKAFSIMREGALSSLNLAPLRRFMPIMTVYYDPADEAAVTGIIGDYLPLENRQLDPIDKLLHKIHF